MIATGIALIALPIAFNVFFAALAKTFDYPDILRRPTSEILKRFLDGGSKLVTLWWGFAMTALAFAPVAVMLSAQIEGATVALRDLATVLGVLAALVQALGLTRWPFVVPYLARESGNASPARSEAIDVVFQSLNRYLGVAVGEHLGYLLTGLWTVTVGVAIMTSSNLPAWLGLVGIVIGIVLAACSFEFVGPFELRGWAVAGAVVPFAYIAWSLWLIGLGIGMLASLT